MTVRTPAPTKAVQLIQSAFKNAKEAEFPLKDAYNLLAKLHGYNSWAVAKAHLEAAASKNESGPISWEVAKRWPTFVFFYAWLSNQDEPELMVLPKECTFDSLERSQYSDNEYSEKGAIRWSDVLAINPELDKRDTMAVAKTYQVTGRVDRYGLPDSVNPRGVDEWCGYMGWGYVASKSVPRGHLVETDFYDNGDDGNREPWMEVFVEPSLAQQLVKVMAEVPPYIDKTYTVEFVNGSVQGSDTLEGLETLIQKELAHGNTPSKVFVEDQHGDKLQDLKLEMVDGSVNLSVID